MTYVFAWPRGASAHCTLQSNMTTPELTQLQKHFLFKFSSGIKFPDALVALDIDAKTLNSWRAQPSFIQAHYRACLDHFRHEMDLLQIEEIRKHLAGHKGEAEPEAAPAVVHKRKK